MNNALAFENNLCYTGSYGKNMYAFMYVCMQMDILLQKMMYVTICEKSHGSYFKNKKIYLF